jgi:hypothetical protein
MVSLWYSFEKKANRDLAVEVETYLNNNPGYIRDKRKECYAWYSFCESTLLSLCV